MQRRQVMLVRQKEWGANWLSTLPSTITISCYECWSVGIWYSFHMVSSIRFSSHCLSLLLEKKTCARYRHSTKTQRLQIRMGGRWSRRGEWKCIMTMNAFFSNYKIKTQHVSLLDAFEVKYSLKTDRISNTLVVWGTSYVWYCYCMFSIQT